MRTVVVEALGRIGRPPASALLMEALDDPHPAVRVRAIEALSRLGTRGLARRLTDIVRSDHSPDVRRIAEVALARAGGADAQRES
jgi:HEAT repeat protein